MKPISAIIAAILILWGWEILAAGELKHLDIVEIASVGNLRVANAPEKHRGYKYLREPNALVTGKGTLLVAFGPHHVKGRNDRAYQDILLRRSGDGGKSWSQIVCIADHGMDSVLPTALVYDTAKQRVLLVYNVIYNAPDRRATLPSRQFVIQSEDEGESWSRPREILKAVGNICVFGGGNGFQVHHGDNVGRLIIPGGIARGGWFFSDDHGRSWSYRKIVNRGRREATGCETSDGTLVLYHRNSRGFGILESRSTDDGETWSPQRMVLPDLWGQCNNAALTVDHRGGELLIVAGPVGPKNADRIRLIDDATRLQRGTEDSIQAARSNGAVFVSRDGGRSFPRRALVAPGWTFGYNALVDLGDGRIGLVFEGSDGVLPWRQAKRDPNTGAQLGIHMVIVDLEQLLSTSEKQ